MRRAAGVTAALAVTTLVAAGCSDDTVDKAKDAAGSAANSASQAVDPNASEGAGGKEGQENAGKDVELDAADGSKVKLTGSIAEKFNTATEKQKTDLGAPLTGPEASGKSESGVTFQQFDGGVISAKADGPAYITWGKIRDAWNVKRDDSGKPAEDGKGGSDGPLGAPTSDETEEGTMKKSTFENGEITWDSKGDKTEVKVKDEVVPAE